MRKLLPVVVLLPYAALLTACPKKGGDAADAGAEAEAPPAATSAAPAAAAPTAKNAGDVARFGTEKALANEAAKTVDAVSTVRTGPRQGGTVATLKAGTDVVKIADFKDTFLVTFADPKDATTTLMGWIGKEAFAADVIVDAGPKDAAADAAKDAGVDAAVATVDAGAAAKCAAGQELIVGLGAAPVCKKKCATDKDCGGAAGTCAPGTAQGGKVVRFCTN